MKFDVTLSVSGLCSYLIEAADEKEAQEKAIFNWKNGLPSTGFHKGQERITYVNILKKKSND